MLSSLLEQCSVLPFVTPFIYRLVSVFLHPSLAASGLHLRRQNLKLSHQPLLSFLSYDSLCGVTDWWVASRGNGHEEETKLDEEWGVKRLIQREWLKWYIVTRLCTPSLPRTQSSWVVERAKVNYRTAAFGLSSQVIQSFWSMCVTTQDKLFLFAPVNKAWFFSFLSSTLYMAAVGMGSQNVSEYK